MSKRANGEGSVSYERDRKKYRAVLFTPQGERLCKRFDYRHEAAAWLVEQQQLINTKSFVEKNAWTLGSWVNEYLETYARPKIRQRTFETYRNTIRHLNAIANTPLEDVTTHLLQRHYVTLAESYKDIPNKLHKIIKAALKAAVINNLLIKNAAEYVTTPKSATEEKLTFEPEEVQKLIATAAGHRWLLVIILGATTGMRLSEILGLRWKDIDIAAKTLTVAQTLHYSEDKGIILEQTKTKAGNRKIALSDATVAAIVSHEAGFRTDNELVITSHNNKPARPNQVQRWWRETIKKAGVPHRGFHSLRHTHATLLLSNGIPVTDVSRRLGHASPTITLNTYSHLIKGNDERIAGLVDNLLNFSTLCPRLCPDQPQTQ